jgi:hypothetical protein|tara:strand:+ start:8340 stop:8531 length:192 start_codon:yes stop_codon:yes gene_type:complete
MDKTDALDITKSLAKSIKVKQAARAVRPCGFDGEIDFTVFCNGDVLNDVKFWIRSVVVRVLPC